MGKGRRRVCILKRAGLVVACPSHSRSDLREQQRGHDQRIVAVLHRGEDRQALRVALFVWVERVHEDARVNRVPQSPGTRGPNWPARGPLSGSHPIVAWRRGDRRRSRRGEIAARHAVRRARTRPMRHGRLRTSWRRPRTARGALSCRRPGRDASGCTRPAPLARGGGCRRHASSVPGRRRSSAPIPAVQLCGPACDYITPEALDGQGRTRPLATGSTETP